MDNRKTSPSRDSKLRHQAEEQLIQRKSKTNAIVSEADMLKLIHELEVHQIELELQNEELILANQWAKEATEKYIELYDFAPSGYFTLSRLGEILETNLKGAQMLGKERQSLINNRFALFINNDNRAVFDDLLSQIFMGKNPASCEVILTQKSDSPVYALLGGTLSDDGKSCIINALDITARKQVENALGREKSNLFAIFESSPVAMFILDETTKIVQLNAAAVLMAGGNNSDALNQRPGNFLRCIHSSKDPLGCGYSDDCKVCKVRNGIESLIANGGSIRGAEIELELNTNGIEQKIWMRIGAEPIQLNDRLHLCVAMDDISELKYSALLIKEKSNKIASQYEELKQINLELITANDIAETNRVNITAIIEGTNDSIWAFDRNYDILYINKTFQNEFYQVFGVWLEYGVNLLEAHPDFLQPIWKPRYDRVLSNEQFKIEDAIEMGNEIIYVEVSFNPIIRNGQVVGGSCIGSNITTRKLAEKELIEAKGRVEESEERYALVIDASEQGIWDWNIETNEVFFSAQWKRQIGYDDHEIKNDFGSWVEHLHPDDKEASLNAVQAYLNNPTEHFFHEFRFRHKDGNYRWIYNKAASILNNEGKVVRVFGAHSDITDWKEAEILIKKQNEELKKLNAFKDKFFSIIAHDLKSPFNSIVGLSEILVEQINEKDYGGIEKIGGIIHQSSLRAMNLLNNLMEWSQSQIGRMEFNQKRFDLVEFIHNNTLLFDDIAGQKGITIKREIPSKAIVFADPAMIHTVLRNLLSNAIKFTKPGGEIIVSVNEEKDKIMVSVKDNGIGIPKEVIGKLFRIDENYSTRGTANETGTGLGLMLCKEFIEKHDGEIWVESEVEKGSTFYFTLPQNIL